MDKSIRQELDKQVESLVQFCKKNKIPAGFVFANDTPKKTEYESTIVTPLQCGVTLKEDRITPMLVLFNEGFSIIPKTSVDYDFASDALKPEDSAEDE